MGSNITKLSLIPIIPQGIDVKRSIKNVLLLVAKVAFQAKSEQ